MGWFILAHFFSTFLSFIRVSRLKSGQPKIQQGKENWIVRLAKENLRWGYGKSRVNCSN